MPADKAMRIIVVDDMGTMRKIVKNMLTKLGYPNVDEADDGKTAWPMVEAKAKAGDPYKFIISDWNMPGMQGIDFLKHVRGSAEDSVKKVKFLMVTAEAEQSNVIEAAKAGVNDYVVKPFNQPTLEGKVTKLFP